MPDSRVLPEDGDPAEVAAARETIRLAFLATLQHLPPKQRAVLILREVLRWQADEVAELLETTVASVNSALQRARATLAAAEPAETDVAAARTRRSRSCWPATSTPSSATTSSRWSRCCTRTRRMSHAAVLAVAARAGRHRRLARGARRPVPRLAPVPVRANGCRAFGQYRPSEPNGEHEPWALQVVEIRDGRIAGLNAFLDVERMFPLFGLPATPPPAA